MSNPRTFNPGSDFAALLNRIYEIKFSRSVPLVVILLSGIYAIYRSMHYISSSFHLDWFIAAPTAISIELLVLGASANVFIQLRRDYVAELDKQDRGITQWGVHLGMLLLTIAFLALIGIAGADAWKLTQDYVATFLLTLVQIAQSGFIVSFVISALLDERDDLRSTYADLSRRTCPYCGVSVSPNNRARHMNTCPKKP
jgi:hypothetical protein